MIYNTERLHCVTVWQVLVCEQTDLDIKDRFQSLKTRHEYPLTEIYDWRQPIKFTQSVYQIQTWYCDVTS